MLNAKFGFGTLAHGQADAAEAAIQRAVRKAVDKSNAFTAKKPTDTKQLADLKGYVIIITLVSVTPDERDLKCRLEGTVVHYPRELNKDKRKGELMVTSKFNGGGKADTANAVVDVVEAVTEEMMKTALPRIKAYDDNLKAP